MTTPKMIRCKDCAYLCENEKGEWVYDDCEKCIKQIEDEDCSMNQDW